MTPRVLWLLARQLVSPAAITLSPSKEDMSVRFRLLLEETYDQNPSPGENPHKPSGLSYMSARIVSLLASRRSVLLGLFSLGLFLAAELHARKKFLTSVVLQNVVVSAPTNAIGLGR